MSTLLGFRNYFRVNRISGSSILSGLDIGRYLITDMVPLHTYTLAKTVPGNQQKSMTTPG
jgi:hypothetical protein